MANNCILLIIIIIIVLNSSSNISITDVKFKGHHLNSLRLPVKMRYTDYVVTVVGDDDDDDDDTDNAEYIYIYIYICLVNSNVIT